MRTFLILITLFSLLSCTGENLSSVNSSNANLLENNQNSTDKNITISEVSSEKRQELDLQNENFRTIPDEWKKINFENFKYPVSGYAESDKKKLIKLENGEYQYTYKNNSGGVSFSLNDVFYVDLLGNYEKEAVILVSVVSCGGSCDGGAEIIYFYSIQSDRPRLIDYLELGSKSGGCSLRALIIKEKKIGIEQFSKCTENSNNSKEIFGSCKFCQKDITKTVWIFKNLQLVEEKSEITETPEVNIMSYSPNISINN